MPALPPVLYPDTSAGHTEPESLLSYGSGSLHPRRRNLLMSSHSSDAPLAAIWTGVADAYDAYRPHTPAVLLDLLPQLAGIQRPQLVVDLGSGTGLSTFDWVGRADAVIGVEPNADMRRRAE